MTDTYIVTLCRTCRASAPFIRDSDGGFVGRLSLDSVAQASPDGTQGFGFIYAGFEAIGMVTAGLYFFREFLQRHQGHEVVTSVRRDTEDVELSLEWEDDQATADDGDLPAGWAMSEFELRCKICNKRCRTELAEPLRVGPERAVTQEQARLFSDAVMPAVPASLRGCEPYDLDELTRLVGFMRRHQGHELVSRGVGIE
jgi:hypothetical protein